MIQIFIKTDTILSKDFDNSNLLEAKVEGDESGNEITLTGFPNKHLH